MQASDVILGLIAAVVLIGIGFFSSRKAEREDAKIIDLNTKISQENAAEKTAAQTADEKTKEYLDALNKYDPNFNDDNSGKPSA